MGGDGGREVFAEGTRIAAAQIVERRANRVADRRAFVRRAVHADRLDREAEPG